jgi:hypothetical protein
MEIVHRSFAALLLRVRALLPIMMILACGSWVYTQTTVMSPQPREIQNIGVHTGANPAAGAEWSVTVPANQLWKVTSVTATLVTAVAAANREVSLVTDDGAVITTTSPTGLTHVASLTKAYTWIAFLSWRGVGAQALNQVTGMGEHWLPAGHRIRTVTTNIQAADDWSAPVIVFESYR